MTNREVVEAFLAQRVSYGSNPRKSLYFEGRIIYSYGRHFILARFEEDGSLTVTIATYSTTTSMHTALVRRMALRAGIRLNKAML